MIRVGNCVEVLREYLSDSIDAIVTDPPYHLVANKKDDPRRASPDSAQRARAGFMGMAWDGGDVAFRPETWAEALRVAKPGAHLLAFGGTRTFHRLMCAIEDAGWELRDTLMWVYGSGFPKSKNLDGDWEGWGTALKPSWEPIVLARKPLSEPNVAANIARWRTGALNIDGCRIPTDEPLTIGAGGLPRRRPDEQRGAGSPAPASPLGRWPANLVHDGSGEVLAQFPQDAGAAAPVTVRNGEKFRNSYGTFAGNRDEEASSFHGDTGSAARFFYCAKTSREDRNDGCEGLAKKPLHWSSGEANPGSFQSEGTDKSAANHHPTVKPTDLMRWLCRMVTPPGGVVLDMFTGSGSTGRGATLEGFDFVGIELDPEYARIAEARIRACQPGLPF